MEMINVSIITLFLIILINDFKIEISSFKGYFCCFWSFIFMQ